jgi:low temperature requirement protein LtrA
MGGRDPAERGRPVTSLELLYDLTYVVAFAAAAGQLAEHLSHGPVWAALGAYVFVAWAVTWAWLNFTWFASAYGNDDALFRVVTIVQMVGVVVLVYGVPVSFDSAAHGQSPLNLLIVSGYIVMRAPLVVMWLRAAHQDPARRRSALAYVFIISIAQVAWLLLAIAGLPLWETVVGVITLAGAEMVAPIIAAHRFGYAPWNAGHIAERFALLTLITIGEVIADTVGAVGALTQQKGWSVEAVLIVASGLVIAAAIWWTYSLVPSRLILETRPGRTFGWRGVHLPLFGTIAAVGAGLRLATIAVERGSVSLFLIAVALALPVAATIVLIFVIWSVLMRSFDPAHLPLLAVTLVPLIAAVVIGYMNGPSTPLNLDEPGGLVSLSAVIALVAAGAIIEVVGHELVGFRHTMRAWMAHPDVGSVAGFVAARPREQDDAAEDGPDIGL